jgi:hypothetical protein
MKLNIPTVLPISPYLLHAEARDFWGEGYPQLVRLLDPILQRGCYTPRFLHAPATPTELVGVAGSDYLEYVMSVVPGSWILGYGHRVAYADSSFLCQITDVGLDAKFFSQPVPDQYFNSPGRTRATPARLLPSPWPVTPPGQYRIEFWNQQVTANNLIQLTFLVAEPDPGLLRG